MSLLAYLQSPGRIVFVHTEVPPELRGRGIASELARRALDYARREGLRVVVQCPFVAGYLRAHPEYADLLESM
jgi:predicted GNAT family acetyltransferase